MTFFDVRHHGCFAARVRPLPTAGTHCAMARRNWSDFGDSDKLLLALQLHACGIGLEPAERTAATAHFFKSCCKAPLTDAHEQELARIAQDFVRSPTEGTLQLMSDVVKSAQAEASAANDAMSAAERRFGRQLECVRTMEPQDAAPLLETMREQLFSERLIHFQVMQKLKLAEDMQGFLSSLLNTMAVGVSSPTRP